MIIQDDDGLCYFDPSFMFEDNTQTLYGQPTMTLIRGSESRVECCLVTQMAFLETLTVHWTHHIIHLLHPCCSNCGSGPHQRVFAFDWPNRRAEQVFRRVFRALAGRNFNKHYLECLSRSTPPLPLNTESYRRIGVLPMLFSEAGISCVSKMPTKDAIPWSTFS